MVLQPAPRALLVRGVVGLVVGSCLPACPLVIEDDFISERGPGSSGQRSANQEDQQAAGAGGVAGETTDTEDGGQGGGGKGNGPPSCDDGEKNGGESDIDCGRVCPVQCEVDTKCREGGDCQSGLCEANKCKQPKKN